MFREAEGMAEANDNRKHADIDHVTEKLKLHRPGILGEQTFKKNSVLVPLVTTEEGKMAVLFTKRAASLRRQAGEICFPGGHWEEDDRTEWNTALRETVEELRVSPESIEYVGDLDIFVTPAGLIIYPFVGKVSATEPIHPNPDEVDSFFTVDLETLLSIQPLIHHTRLKVEPAEDFPYHLVPNGEQYQWRTGTFPQYFYEIDGHVIWGLTARILSHFLDVIRS